MPYHLELAERVFREMNTAIARRARRDATRRCVRTALGAPQDLHA